MNESMFPVLSSFGQTGAVLVMAWFFLSHLQKQVEITQKAQDERDIRSQKAQDDRDNRQKEMFMMLHDKFSSISINVNQVIKENTDIIQRGHFLTETLVNTVKTAINNQTEIIKASNELKNVIKEQTRS